MPSRSNSRQSCSCRAGCLGRSNRSRVAEAIGPELAPLRCAGPGPYIAQESPRKARTVYRQIAVCCQALVVAAAGGIRSNRRIEESVHESGTRTGAERPKPMGKSDHRRILRDYLQNFQTIPNVADFWRLMDHSSSDGEMPPGERILDAGCGNGNFGVFLQLNRHSDSGMARREISFSRPCRAGFRAGGAGLPKVNFEQVGGDVAGNSMRGCGPMSPCRARVPGLTFRTSRCRFPTIPSTASYATWCWVRCGTRCPHCANLLALATPGGLVISNLSPMPIYRHHRNFVDTAQTADKSRKAVASSTILVESRNAKAKARFISTTRLNWKGSYASRGCHARVYSRLAIKPSLPWPTRAGPMSRSLHDDSLRSSREDLI